MKRLSGFAQTREELTSLALRSFHDEMSAPGAWYALIMPPSGTIAVRRLRPVKLVYSAGIEIESEATMIRSPEDLAAAKARIKEEYGALPDFSAFGSDNRAEEKLLLRILARIEEGESIFGMIDEMYDRADDASPNQQDSYYNAVHLLYWADGDEDEPL